jgi:diguanylate cyclase (GGDEF)-like protein
VGSWGEYAGFAQALAGFVSLNLKTLPKRTDDLNLENGLLTFKTSRPRLNYWIASLCLLLIAAAGAISLSGLALSARFTHVLSGISLAGPMLIGALGCELASKKPGLRSLKILGFGLLAMALGEIGLNHHLLSTGNEAESPHFTDIFFLIANALIAISGWQWAKQLGLRGRTAWLDAGLTLVVALLVAWVSVIRFAQPSPSSNSVAYAISLLYPITNALTCASSLLALSASIQRNSHKLGTAFFALGSWIFATADILWSNQNLLGAYKTGGIIDYGWVIGYPLLAIAPYHIAAFSGSSEYKKTSGFAAFAAWMPVALSVLATAIVVAADLRNGGYIEGVTLGVVIAVSILVSIRNSITLRESMTELENLNVGLETTVQERTATLNARFQLVRSMSASNDIPSLFALSLPQVFDAVRADGAILFLRQDTSPNTPALHKITMGETFGVDSILDDWLHDDAHSVRTMPLEAGLGSGILLQLPIQNGTEILGGIGFIRNEGTFGQADREDAEALALELSGAVSRIVLFERAVEAAERDYLTNLFNYRAIMRRVQDHFLAAETKQADPEPIGMLLLDVDNFKLFNDTYGHTAGDQVLKFIAKALKVFAQPGDVIGRTSGDEFIVLLPGRNLGATYKAAIELNAHLKSFTFRVKGRKGEKLPINVNIGVAACPESGISPYALLHRADASLGEARRNQVSIAHEEGREHAPHAESLNAIDMMMNVIDASDSYTRRHSEDVAKFSTWIGETMGLSTETIRALSLTALMHDVGKIAVPPSILRKPSSLTDEEFGILKQHPVIGHIIVTSMPGLEDTADGVKYHHERWDGQGYPDGLSGEDIPFEARVLAVADAFSAMTTDRTYRKGMDLGVAAERIKRGAGTQFDPEIVECFLEALATRGIEPDPTAGTDNRAA